MSDAQMEAATDSRAATTDEEPIIPIMPYSWIVGQEELKLALEIAYLAPAIRGVLLSGDRGTGKSTAVRAFARMLYGGQKLPVTLPSTRRKIGWLEAGRSTN